MVYWVLGVSVFTQPHGSVGRWSAPDPVVFYQEMIMQSPSFSPDASHSNHIDSSRLVFLGEVEMLGESDR